MDKVCAVANVSVPLGLDIIQCFYLLMFFTFFFGHWQLPASCLLCLNAFNFSSVLFIVELGKEIKQFACLFDSSISFI